MSNTNPFGAEATLSTSGGSVKYFSLRKLIDAGIGDIETLPYSIRVLLEACLRNIDNFIVTADDVTNLANWNAAKPARSRSAVQARSSGAAGLHRCAGRC
jgi:aconitate hydratase